MADPLSIRVPISPEALIAAGRVSEAAKAAQKELKVLEARAKKTFEATGLVGQGIEQRMQHLRGNIQEANHLKRDMDVQLQEQRRDMEQFAGQKGMVKDLKFFTQLSQAESIKRLATEIGRASCRERV